ncbi:MAG TPA: Uma2 family endonuclease [Thermoanaerobaculia bacterium]|nr:Uma2 family endonuclease [Thermoanaerobaculia bacterium]
MLALDLTRHSAREESPTEDRIVLLEGATWGDFQRLLEIRGDRPVPRMAYLEGVLELMSPSQPHEALKSWIGCLVEAWCLEKGIEFSPYGSWTLEKKEAQRAVEPDECYVFGDEPLGRPPDLAIEVVWTSGGLDKLEIYRKLSVREVWVWRRGRLTVHVLEGESYQEVPASEVLPGIDLDLLLSCLDRPTASQAIRAYRELIQS